MVNWKEDYDRDIEMHRQIFCRIYESKSPSYIHTIFPHKRTAGIILCSLQMRVLLENTTFLLHKVIRIAGIIRVAGIIRGRVLYEEIRYRPLSVKAY